MNEPLDALQRLETACLCHRDLASHAPLVPEPLARLLLQALEKPESNAVGGADDLAMTLAACLKSRLQQGAHAPDCAIRLHPGLGAAELVDAFARLHQHLTQALGDAPPEPRGAARRALGEWIKCELIRQLARLQEVQSRIGREQRSAAHALLSAAIELGEQPAPETVFSRLCQNLADTLSGVSAVWFTFDEDTGAPLRPLYGAGDERIWKAVTAPEAADDPLWVALASGRTHTVRADRDPVPAWWPQEATPSAAVIVPFGKPPGRRGLGVIHLAEAAGADALESALFTAFAALAQRMLDLREAQFRDPLTGLANRRLFMDRLQHEMHRALRQHRLLAVGVLDLDGFKPINDLYGHAAGDALLRQLAARLSEAMRHGDTLARLGGDEFGLLFADLNEAGDAERAVRRLLEALESPFRLEERTFRIHASVGLTLYPLDDAPATELLRHADIAMYQAKASGRHGHRLYEYAAERQRRRALALQDRIDRALETGHIEFHYQPKIDLARGHLFGVEALARWREGASLHAPGEFIGAVEDSPHLSRRFGRHALFHAARQIERWQAQGQSLGIALNIGAKHLLDPAFTTDLDAVLARHPHVAPWIELEVTERAALSDLDLTRRALQACRERGFSVALDDFGTGYASLSYLQQLPADHIKLDRSFVSRLLDDPRTLAVVSGAIASARMLNLDVIAEGIETPAQGELLLQLGCRYGQGYFIARPLPAGQLDSWLAQWRPPEAWTLWQENRLGPDEMDFLMAKTACLRAMHALIEALAGAPESDSPPGLVECVDSGHSPLDAWLQGPGKRYRALPAVRALIRDYERQKQLLFDLALKWRDGTGGLPAAEVEAARLQARALEQRMRELLVQINRQRREDDAARQDG